MLLHKLLIIKEVVDLNDYNMLQYTNYLKYGGGNNKVINGSPFYDGVTGNNRFSSKYESPLKEQILSCSL